VLYATMPMNSSEEILIEKDIKQRIYVKNFKA